MPRVRSRIGEVDVPEEVIITFPSGLLGFPDVKRFTLLNHKPDSPFRFLQAVDEPDLAFVVMNAFELRPDYAPELWEEDQLHLGRPAPGDLDVYVILTIPEDPSRMTANLLGPVFVNRRLRLGKQVVQQNDAYTTRHLVLEELARARALLAAPAEALRESG